MHFLEWKCMNINWYFIEVCNNSPALVQIMAWRRPGNMPLSEPVMFSLLRQICITQLQWVNSIYHILICIGIPSEEIKQSCGQPSYLGNVSKMASLWASAACFNARSVLSGMEILIVRKDCLINASPQQWMSPYLEDHVIILKHGSGFDEQSF